MTTFHSQILEAEHEVTNLQHAYLERWGWNNTSNTPGSYWLWKRDFSKEDTDTHARWKARGPGPLGWPSEPQPYGVITAPTDLAVSMTVRCLDEQTELANVPVGWSCCILYQHNRSSS